MREDNYHVAQANEKLDAEGHFVRNSVSGHYRKLRSTISQHLIIWMLSQRGILSSYGADSILAER